MPDVGMVPERVAGPDRLQSNSLLRWSSLNDSQAQTQRSLSDAVSRSFGALPTVGSRFPSPPQSKGPADLPRSSKRRTSWSTELVPLYEAGAECSDRTTKTISGFIGPPSRASSGAACSATPAGSKERKAGIGFGLDRPYNENRETFSTCAPSPVASESDGSQASEDTELQVPLAPTLLEVYAGYADEEVEVHDRFMSLAFKRFAVYGAHEVTRELLHDALIHMGFLTSTKQRSLYLATQLSKFQNFDYMDFVGYVSRVAVLERNAIRQRAGACLSELPDGDDDGAAALDRVQQFLRSAGVCFSYSHVESARRAAGLDHASPEHMCGDDLLLTLAACRVNEGFTREEILAAHEIFGELEQEPLVSSSGWGPLVKVSSFLKGLLQFTGLYSVDYVRELFADMLPSDCAGQRLPVGKQGVGFYEFLIWARRLRDPMMQDLWQHFASFVEGGAVFVQVGAAVSIAERVGISLLTNAVDELLADLGLQSDAPLDFHSLVQFIGAARRTHGFSRRERRELGAAFERIDRDGTGELNRLQVLDLFLYLGIHTSVDEANSMISRVDFNLNGTMDRDEFLRLMRLIREQEIQSARKSFDELSSSTRRLNRASVKDALFKLQVFPNDELLEELLQDMPAELSFASFVLLSDGCRSRMNFDFHRRADFPEDEMLEIAKLWHARGQGPPSSAGREALDLVRAAKLWNCGGLSRQFATVAELIWMFSDSQEFRLNTVEGRPELLRRVRSAKEAALAAGVPPEEVSRGGTDDIGFYTFVHLIRGFVRDSEQKVVSREREAESLARFPIARIAELRVVFSEVADQEGRARQRREEQEKKPRAALSAVKKEEGHGDSLRTWSLLRRTVAEPMGETREGQRVDALLARLTKVPAVPESALPVLLKSAGAKAPSSKLRDLSAFLAQTRGPTEAIQETIQFATFLRLLRWVLDGDVAGTGRAVDLPREG